jgi:3-oxoacyl-[acyl-carrier-protein] synthase II
MVSGRSGIGPIRRFDCLDWPVRIGGEVKGFDGLALLGARAAKRMDRFSQFAVVASEEAILDSGLQLPHSQPERVGVFIGTGIGGLEEILKGNQALEEEGQRGVSPFLIPRLLTNLAGGNVALRIGAQGPNHCISTACASGTHSLGEAFRSILLGDCDIAIAGGAEAPMTPLALTGFTVMKALSRNNDNPTEASRPFDLHRDGFVLSEGAGILVLEEMEHAKARGARIYAEFLGYGSTCDAHHLTAPGGGGAERCMALALRSAGLKPEDVDYVNAHGTSTLTNDANETRAIRTLFGAHANRLMVSSTKSVTGHLLGAAGGVEAMATAMALHTGLVPPTATWKTRDPDCDLDVVPGEARAHRVRAALSNSFGFGGTNASIVLGRFED